MAKKPPATKKASAEEPQRKITSKRRPVAAAKRPVVTRTPEVTAKKQPAASRPKVLEPAKTEALEPEKSQTKTQAPAAVELSATGEKPAVVETPQTLPDTAEIEPTHNVEPTCLEAAHTELAESVHMEEALPEAQPIPSEPVHVEAPLPEVSPESVHVEESLPEAEPEPPGQKQAGLFIVHIAPEMAPVAKVGGLADVVFGLTGELGSRGNQVEVILPLYDTLRRDHVWDLQEAYRDLWVPWYDGAIHCTVFSGHVHGRNCFFIESHSQDDFFNRGSIYGFEDDVLRYAFFSRAAMEFLWKSGRHPDIIHCHDWQTALAPIFLYEIYQQLGMSHPRVCFTIHNFSHQGLSGMEMLKASGLHRPERFFDYERLQDNNNPLALNLLKGGIVYSNFITTVSPRYAFETKEQEQGFGLESTLHTHQIKYGGVVNGIDYQAWNPQQDSYIPAAYGPDSVDGKYVNKRALRRRLMLADNEKPIVAFIGRLDPQKGLDLVRHAIFHTLERGAQFVLLGSSPDPLINEDFWGLKRMLNDSPDCHLEIGFNEELAHLIYAGSDMMLVPSRFEPCGLTQLIALRYGTVPVVREVGGLADTIADKDHSHLPLHERNGYVFQDYSNVALESALGRAIACYFNHPADFRELMKNAMRSDYSWQRPGQDYLNIYDLIRNK